MALDGMRGLAAAAVVALHICNLFNLGFALPLAHLAVDFFFMLSGVVLTHAYEERLNAGALGFRGFLLERVLRLQPMVLMGVGLGIVVLSAGALVHHDISLSRVALVAVCGFFLVPSPFLLNFRPWAFPVDNPLWSLSAEFVVNLVFAAALRQIRTGILVVLAVLSGAELAVLALQSAGVDFGYSWSSYACAIIRATCPFTIGMLLYRIFGRWKTAVPGAGLVPLLLPAILLLPVRIGAWGELALIAVVFPVLILLGMRTPSKFVLQRPWTFVGVLSYPVYVLHYPIITAAANVAKILHASGWKLAVAAGFTAIVIAAMGMWAGYVYDPTVRRAAKRLRNGLSSRREDTTFRPPSVTFSRVSAPLLQLEAKEGAT